MARRKSPIRRIIRKTLVAFRAGIRQGTRRSTGSFFPIFQAALGCALAWAIAHHLLGHPNPIFAPIATWVCLGFKVDKVPRKVAELGAGATVGVLLGEVFASFLEIGWWQILILLPVAALLARFLDHGELFTVQAGVNAIVVLGMSWYTTQTGGATARWLDALVGAFVAFVIAVLLPRKVSHRSRRYAAAALAEMSKTLALVARGIRERQFVAFEEAGIQRHAGWNVFGIFEEALSTARDVVTLNPTLRREQPTVDELERIFRLTRRAHRTESMLSRQAEGMLEEVGSLPQLADLVRRLAVATDLLSMSVQHWERPVFAREILTEVAAQCAPAEIHSDDWRPTALMSLMRALVVDLLQITGLSRADARGLLPDTWGMTFADDKPPELADDDTSPLWG